MGYIPGDPWGCCQRCGFKVRLSTIRKEWTGLRVCPKCWDPRHPQLDVQAAEERIARIDALPEPPDVFISPGDHSPDDL